LTPRAAIPSRNWVNSFSGWLSSLMTNSLRPSHTHRIPHHATSVVGPCRRRVWSTSTPLYRIEPFVDSAVQTVNHRRWSVSGRSSTVLEQAARQCHVSQFVVGFPAATETYTVPAVIPRHYHVTFLNCDTHSVPSSGIATQATLKIID